MGDIALSAAVRDSLLSLQGTTNLIERTQNRLSSGLRVASPVDDPVSFFQAKGLNDRAFDFNEKKDGIDQGVSSLTAALDGVEAIETLVRQLKGVAQSMKSAEDSQVGDLINQFNDLRDQINNLATDSTYQGLNLINGTGTTLEIEFSEKTASLLSVSSVDLTVDDTTGGLNIQSVDEYTGQFVVDRAEIDADPSILASNAAFTAGETISMTWQGPSQTYTTSDTAEFVVNSETFTVNFGSSATTFTAGTTFDLTVTTAFSTAVDAQIIGSAEVKNNFSISGAVSGGNFSISSGGTAQTAAIATGDLAVLDTGDVFEITNRGGEVTLSTANDGNDTFTINGVEFTLHVGCGTDCAYSFNEAITASIVASETQIGSGEIGLVVCAAHLQNTTAATATNSQGTNYFAVTAHSGNTTTLSAQIGWVCGGALVNCAADGTSATSIISGDTAGILGIAASSTASLDSTAITTAASGADFIRAGDTVLANEIIDDLDSALTTLRTESQNLGTNVAVLQTRLDFTETYTNTLETGAAKLTLADINEEGANLLALQTRQQLGIQSLSFAGQAEQQILSLFR